MFVNNFPKTSPAKRNLILGMVDRFEIEEIAPFISSLKKTSYRGDVCFIISRLSGDTIAWLHQNKVITEKLRRMLIPIPIFRSNKLAWKAVNPLFHLSNLHIVGSLLYRMLEYGTSAYTEQRLSKCGILSALLRPEAARFPAYYTYLSRHPDAYENILLTDVRDVLFQQDPFAFEIVDGLSCFLEDKTIGESKVNSSWIEEYFGRTIAERFKNKKISCSGTIMGPYRTVMKYLEITADLYMAIRKNSHWGIDQAVHNYIVYERWGTGPKFYTNGNGPVMTYSFFPDERVRFDERGMVVNEDGSVINMLHQYDRRGVAVKDRMSIYRESGAQI